MFAKGPKYLNRGLSNVVHIDPDAYYYVIGYSEAGGIYKIRLTFVYFILNKASSAHRIQYQCQV